MNTFPHNTDRIFRLRQFILVIAALAASALAQPSAAPSDGPVSGAETSPLPRVRVAPDLRGFLDADGRAFAPVGVNYFRLGTGWAPQVWKQFEAAATREDFRRMQELGVNCVRVFLSYGSFYQQPGELEEAGLARFDQFLELAEAHGIYVHPTGPDHWEGRPEWARADRYADESALAAVEEFWRLFAARYRGRTAIFAYDLLNEPEIAWDTPAMRPKWNAWLQRRYGGAETLAAAWGRPVAEVPWGSVAPPAPEPRRGDRELLDYQLFREELADDWTRRQAEAIRSVDRDALVTVGLIQWSVPSALSGVQHYSGFRPERQARFLDFLSVHFYPLENGAYDYQDAGSELRNLAYLHSVLAETARPGLPVVLGEFGWYGGGKPRFDGGRHPFASQEQQARFLRRVVETTAGLAQGWLNWGLHDHPEAGDVTELTGLFTASGERKAWGFEFERLARAAQRREPIGQAPTNLPVLDWESCITDPAAGHAWRAEHARQFEAATRYALFARTNLAAWCIVPFDAKKRGPEERAAMLANLGLKSLAYDYRAEHVPTFDAELEALQRHGIRLLAWWFPGALNDEARLILDVLRRHDLRGVQLWVSGGGDAPKSAEEHRARVEAEAARLQPIAEEAAKLGSAVALYNHGGWFGEPENQLEIIGRLRERGVTNVGLVYNQHHGHEHVDRFPELLERMRPHLLALNLNGMARDGERLGKKILPLGQGELDLQLLRIIQDSGWRGPIGILNHTDEDAQTRLQDNLRGLERLVDQLDRSPAPVGGAQASAPAYGRVESAGERERLPLHQTIPAAAPGELTPANGLPPRETYLTWHRSHGDNGGSRWSLLDQIHRQNVTNLQVAWTYHSLDGSNNLQCNPIIVKGVMFAPTPGHCIVAVNAETGAELWRFKPEGRPAYRGLIYWPGDKTSGGRILFCAGPFLHALDPDNGKPIAGFGDGGKVALPGEAMGEFGAATAAPATFERIVVVPGFARDVWGFDVVTGRHLWTFHTVPRPGEFGYQTWDCPVEYGANCWGGMAMDEARGIAYITTGSPKPNFVGVEHLGQNLFANCVVALDARTGKRLWHFQEIRHDIWDLDIPAPPVLTTITREGRRVDVVAAVTKIGNTLLLDRVSGKPIFPFRLRRAPTSALPGEVTWPYQPDPELPEPFAKLEFTAADLTRRSEESEEFARTRFKSMHSGRFRPLSLGKPTIFFGIDGGAEWTGACADPETGRLYVTANHMGWTVALFHDTDPPPDPKAPMTRGRQVFEQICATCHGANLQGLGMYPALRGLRHRLTTEAATNLVRTGRHAMPAQKDMSEEDLQAVLDYLFLRDRPLPPPGPPSERPRYDSTGYPKFYDHEGYPAGQPPWGTLNCLDLNTGKLLWKVPHGEYAALAAERVPKTGTENYGGAIVTAGGLVFCAGARDNRLWAYDKDTGDALWSAPLPWTGSAPPATYEVNGRQYVVIAATGGNKLGTPYGDAYVAFALPETGKNLSAGATSAADPP